MISGESNCSLRTLRRQKMADNSINTECEWIAEEADCCLSYNAHPIARYLVEECRKEVETKGDNR